MVVESEIFQMAKAETMVTQMMMMDEALFAKLNQDGHATSQIPTYHPSAPNREHHQTTLDFKNVLMATMQTETVVIPTV